MNAEDQSSPMALRAEAAKHEDSAGIIRGSMSSKPSTDDFRQAELMQLELDRAKDKRALANHIVNGRIEKLQAHFEQQTGCSVYPEWKIDLQGVRFYFQDKAAKDWKYILDVHQNDIDAHNAGEIIQRLDAARWLQVLTAYSGKRVPSFRDGKFSDPAAFQEWPGKAA